ncbi:MAG: DNA cytosine methyltransferase, partial [Candidatus Fonsibacter sp.]
MAHPFLGSNCGSTHPRWHEASCEVDARCRQVIRLCHNGNTQPKGMFKDISRRPPERLPDHDLYVAGFPCQPVSRMGSRQGLADKLGRVRICQYGLAALSTNKPRAFVLGNVKGLVAQHRATFDDMLQQLRQIGNGAYKVGYKI